jgi:iron complex transport system ATP-binding protein
LKNSTTYHKLQLKSLYASYKKADGKIKSVLENISVEIHRPGIVCLMGPNGSGKSTLLRCIAGIENPQSGNIFFDELNLQKISKQERSELISIVLTEMPVETELTVFSMVALGRYPYTGWLGRLGEPDEQAVYHALKITGIEELMDRRLDQLSDGERQISLIARALAQQTPFILLDEPTSFLDIPNKVRLMKLLRSLSANENKCIIMATHDLDLAIDMADKIWLLSAGGNFFNGSPEDLALNNTYEKIFDKDQWSFDLNSGKFSMPNTEMKHHVYLSQGDPLVSLWTRKALIKAGINCLPMPQNEEADPSIPLIEITNEKHWKIHSKNEVYPAPNIETLLNNLEIFFKQY